jgi:hypothetical protein
MPVRHEDDYQRKTIKSWDSWVEDAIQEAQRDGEFDNLPDHGKPIKLEDTPFAPEMGSALRTLKNAGYAPTWMEVDRQITQGKEELAEFLQRSAAYLERLVDEATARERVPVQPQVAAEPGRWRRFVRWLTFADETAAVEWPPLTLDDLVEIRARMREQYLERAAAVDKKITEFHAALPRNLWHLERMRLMPEMAARAFDVGCPPISIGCSSAPDQGRLTT